VTLADLVAADHFYRHLDRTFAHSFVRKLVQAHDTNAGRPSIDPVIFSTVLPVQFFLAGVFKIGPTIADHDHQHEEPLILNLIPHSVVTCADTKKTRPSGDVLAA
jgi:hypothetical protein